MKNVNPFYEKGTDIELSYEDMEALNSKPYNKKTASPYTKTRVILMNGTEFEANWFMHQFSRHCNNNDLRREIAKIRKREQQQQKIISSLKPIDENILETTISYEQLAVDLTAILAQNVPDENVKQALDFALLEDFDHLYRFSNLLKMEYGIDAKDIVKEYTEIMPARPLIAEHRYPADEIKKFICSNLADPYTKLTVNIITGAEQQTMNFYMNVANLYPTELGRKLFAETALIEEQHVTQYGSLIDTNCTWLENWLMHEYVEAYLYYSCYTDETNKNIKNIYYKLYLEECGHLQRVAELLLKYEGKPWQSVFPCGGDFPKLLHFDENIDYIRNVIKNTITNTAYLEGYTDVSKLPNTSKFFAYNNTTNPNPEIESGHLVVENFIQQNKEDYRYEVKKHPIPELQSRTKDNTDIGRKK